MLIVWLPVLSFMLRWLPFLRLHIGTRDHAITRYSDFNLAPSGSLILPSPPLPFPFLPQSNNPSR